MNPFHSPIRPAQPRPVVRPRPLARRLVLTGLCLLAPAAALRAADPVMVIGVDRKLTFDAQGKKVFGEPGHDEVLFFDLKDPLHPAPLGSLPLENSLIGPPTNVAVTPDGRLALIANSLHHVPDPASPGGFKPVPADEVFVVDLESRPLRLLATLKVGLQPSGIAVDPAGRFALVANREGRSVSVLALRGPEVTVAETVPVGDIVSGVALTPDGRHAVATKFAAHKLSHPSFLTHYESLLAAHYTWMAGGDYPALVAENRALLERLGVTQCGQLGARALDLGSGSGFQSAALVELGFQVTAVDLCVPLLDELRARNPEAVAAGTLRALQGDLLDLERYRDQGPFGVVVCMGDTLTHLESAAQVGRMVANAAAVLAPGGRLVLRFRDLTVASVGTDRFIPVRTDADKIMTCFLEEDAARPEHVGVTDLIYRRVTQSGADWHLEKSHYRKLRINAPAVRTALAAHGLDLAHEESQRNLITLVSTRS